MKTTSLKFNKKDKLKFSVTVTLKKDVLDPQGKLRKTLKNMGMSALKGIRQGKYFIIEINEKDDVKAKAEVNSMCKKLLVNTIIEDFEILKL